MHILPSAIMACLDPFAPAFSRRVWHHVLVLVVGAILTQALLCNDVDATPTHILA